MFKLYFLVTLLVVGLVCSVSATTPPACILACVNEQEKVSDLKTICGASSTQKCLAARCISGEFDTAVNYFKSICEGDGYDVAKSLPSATATASRTKAAYTSSSSTGSPSSSSSSASEGNRVVSNTHVGILLMAIAAFVLV